MSSSLEAKITFISAGAGSGKTHRLTEILHRELTSKAIRPAGVIATTFTRKAAAELRERTRAHLLGKDDFALANAMGQARIGTVNSVCGQLIDRFAFEAGRATGQQVLEETQASLMLGKAIDMVLNGTTMSELIKLVNRLSLNEEWKNELKRLVDQIRFNDIPMGLVAGFAASNAKDLLSHFPGPTRQDLTALLKESIREALVQLTAAASTKKNTSAYLSFLRTVDRALASDSASWSDWVKLSKESPEAGLASIIEPVAETAARFGEHPGLHADIARYLDLMFDLAKRALVAYDDDKREMGVLDFADQEHLLLGLLDHPTVIEVLTEELDLLMVDEFQDTSPIQLALFLKLARFAKRVYWVGDIKQAIYGFRGSDTELMRAILDELPKLGANKEVLKDSWRSRADLVDVVNAVFVTAFKKTLSKDEIQLQAKRSDALPGAALAN